MRTFFGTFFADLLFACPYARADERRNDARTAHVSVISAASESIHPVMYVDVCEMFCTALEMQLLSRFALPIQSNLAGYPSRAVIIIVSAHAVVIHRCMFAG